MFVLLTKRGGVLETGCKHNTLDKGFRAVQYRNLLFSLFLTLVFS